jgi:ribosome-interacting GTPase 1
MMPFEDIQAQLVDTPAVAPGATPGWVRGLVRQADLLLLVVDLSADPLTDLSNLRRELASFRVAAHPPGIAPDAEEGLLPRTALLVGNKSDAPAASEALELLAMETERDQRALAVSARSGEGLDQLRRRVVEALDVVRVYAKPPGRPPDLQRPFVLPRGATVENLADAIHHTLRDTLRYAVLWAPDKPPLRVARHYALQDGDVLELHGS